MMFSWKKIYWKQNIILLILLQLRSTITGVLTTLSAASYSICLNIKNRRLLIFLMQSNKSRSHLYWINYSAENFGFWIRENTCTSSANFLLEHGGLHSVISFTLLGKVFIAAIKSFASYRVIWWLDSCSVHSVLLRFACPRVHFTSSSLLPTTVPWMLWTEWII